MNSTTDRIAPLRDFVMVMTRVVSSSGDEAVQLQEGRRFLSTLTAEPDWLPEACAHASARAHRQYLLHRDLLERFSVVSFVWGPGSTTPVHDHTVWGLVGMYRSQELCDEYECGADGQVRARGHCHTLRPGMIEAVSPPLGDWHRVSNGLSDHSSISIHVYGSNIRAVHRHKLNAASGAVESFISGYSSEMVPKLWDRSRGA